MGILTVTTFLSLDGVMQAPGGPGEDPSGGFRYEGWLGPHADEVFGKTMAEIFTHADAFLLGRGTYQIFAGYWPKITEPGHPIADPLNTLPKVVVSRSLAEASWKGTTIARDVSVVKEMKSRYAREIQVHGSPGLAKSLAAEGLVDEYRLLQFPVVLGAGKRLFDAGSMPATFALVSTAATTKGVVINRYRRVGEVKTMSIEDIPNS